ncbi:hypothetical protein Trydic_g16211 [Trypoxylus dichotomus]
MKLEKTLPNTTMINGTPKSKKKIPPILGTHNSDKTEEFANYFEGTFRHNPPVEKNHEKFTDVINKQVHTEYRDTITVQETTTEEVWNIIKTLADRKAPGHDGITNTAIKHLTLGAQLSEKEISVWSRVSDTGTSVMDVDPGCSGSRGSSVVSLKRSLPEDDSLPTTRGRIRYPSIRVLRILTVPPPCQQLRGVCDCDSENRQRRGRIVGQTDHVFIYANLNSKHSSCNLRVDNWNSVLLRAWLDLQGELEVLPSDSTHFRHTSLFEPDVLDISVSKNWTFPLGRYSVQELSCDYYPVITNTYLALPIPATGTLYPLLNYTTEACTNG